MSIGTDEEGERHEGTCDLREVFRVGFDKGVQHEPCVHVVKIFPQLDSFQGHVLVGQLHRFNCVESKDIRLFNRQAVGEHELSADHGNLVAAQILIDHRRRVSPFGTVDEHHGIGRVAFGGLKEIHPSKRLILRIRIVWHVLNIQISLWHDVGFSGDRVRICQAPSFTACHHHVDHL